MGQTIYISYAWGDNPDTAEERAIHGLCNALTHHNFTVIFDRSHLGYQDSISNFCKTIGEGGIVIPIIGEKYFTRLNCLIEATNMIKTGDIQKRIFPLVLPNICKIYNAKERAKMIKEIEDFWKDSENEIIEAININNSFPGAYITIRQDLNVIDGIIASIGEFINYIGDNLQFNFTEQLQDTNFIKFIKFIINKTKENISKPYYQKIEGKYFGREEDINIINKFLTDDKQHFLLLFGIGGMGKSHLISVCLDKFNYHREFFWTRASKNFELRNLFEVCNLRYPIELEDTEKIFKQFLDYFTNNNIFLIIDDFYEIIDVNVRKMLPDLARLPKGKLLIISRAIPKEIENQKINHHQILPLEYDDYRMAMNEYIRNEKKRMFSDDEMKKIYNKTQGYPLGGQLIIRLNEFYDNLDNTIDNLPSFEEKFDPEGKRFSERLLDDIFHKSNYQEIQLLCELSALFGDPYIEELKCLPSFNLNCFNTLVNRRRFITKDSFGRYSIHAMIRDYAYEMLAEKESIHKRLGSYYEEKLKDTIGINWRIVELAIYHYKNLDKNELELFGQRMFKIFPNNNVKSIINGSLNNTIRNLKFLIEIYPNNMSYYNQLGIAYRKNNQIELAIQTFKTVITRNPMHLHSYNQLGICYRENNQIELAIQTFKTAITKNPLHLHSYNQLGICYREIRQIQLAINTFKQGIKIDSNHLYNYNELGITYRANNQIQQAFDIFFKALEINPKHYPTYNELKKTFLKLGKKQSEIESFINNLIVKPKHLIILIRLGIDFRENNQIKLAIIIFQKVINICPHHLYANYQLGITYRKNNQIALAIKTFLKIYPRHLQTYSELKNTFIELGRKQINIYNFIKALKIEPNNVKLLVQLGKYFRKNNEIQLAIITFLKAIEINPKHFPSYNQLGITYRKNKQVQKAIKAFKDAIEINPKHLHSYNELGITYRENNQVQLAIKAFKDAIEINPKHIHSYNGLSITYRESKQYEEAKKMSLKSIEIKPTVPSYLNLLIFYIFFRPDAAKALEYFNIINTFALHSSLKKKMKLFKVFIEHLDSITSYHFDLDLINYYILYTQYAYYYNAYNTIIPILFHLNEMFPNNPRIVRLLGKTLSNKKISRYKEGRIFLKHAIQLLSFGYTNKEKQKLLIFYFYNLLHNNDYILLAKELKYYKKEIKQDSSYLIFRANYYQNKSKSNNKVIRTYKKAINNSSTKDEKIKTNESLLRYLTLVGRVKYSLLYYNLLIETINIPYNYNS